MQYRCTEIQAPLTFHISNHIICLSHRKNVCIVLDIFAVFCYRQSFYTFSLKSEVDLTCGSVPVQFERSWDVNLAGEKINVLKHTCDTHCCLHLLFIKPDLYLQNSHKLFSPIKQLLDMQPDFCKCIFFFVMQKN